MNSSKKFKFLKEFGTYSAHMPALAHRAAVPSGTTRHYFEPVVPVPLPRRRGMARLSYHMPNSAVQPIWPTILLSINDKKGFVFIHT